MTAAPIASVEAEKNRPVASLPFERKRVHGVTCVVESCFAMRLTGWALVQPWQPAGIELRQGEHLVDVQVRRTHRPDVLSGLGADPRMELALGFSIELPPELWLARTADGSILLHLSVDGFDADMPHIRLTIDDLEEWRQSLLWAAEPGAAAAERERLGAHLKHHLAPMELKAAVDRMEREAPPPAADRPQENSSALRWAVEEIGHLHVTGWAVAPMGGEERFELVCNGHVLPAECIRLERSDVQQALGDVRLDSGFEVALPPSLWRHVPVGRMAHLQLLVNGQPVLQQILKLDRARLSEMLSHWRASAQPLGTTAAEHRYHALALIEHVQAAGLLSTLPRDDLKFIADAAAAEGLHLAWPLTFRVDPAHMAIARELWLLQRAFNTHLCAAPAGPQGLVAAIEQTVLQLNGQVSTVAMDRFHVSLIPTFCSHGALDILRPRLPQHELDTLAHSEGRWELSILIPVTLMDEMATAQGRLEATGNLLERLCQTADGGWIETVGLQDAWRRLANDAALLTRDDEDLRRLVSLSLRFYDSLEKGPASRLHDACLIQGMHHLLALAGRLGDAPGEAVAGAAVRLYGLCPGFWECAAPAPELVAGPALLWNTARSGLDELVAGLQRLAAGDPAAVDDCRLALANLRGLGCDGVDEFHRHLLLAHAACATPEASQALRLVQGLHPREALRWLGRSQPTPADAFPPQEFARLLLDTAPAPHVPHVALRRALLGAPEGRLAAAVSLCSESQGFIGLLWLAQETHLGSAEAGAALDAALDRTLAVCERHRMRHAHPPAALSGVAAWVESHPAASSQGAAPRSARLSLLPSQVTALWPQQNHRQPLPIDPALSVSAPGVGTLVVVRSRQPADNEAFTRISQGWGADLLGASIPWLLWRDLPGPASLLAPAPHEPPHQVRANGLMALLAWLLGSSDFGHVLLVDDDVELAVDAWRLLSGGPAHHYHGAALLKPLSSTANPSVLDKSPRGTRFASTEQGLALSRLAVERALQLRTTSRGARLGRDSFDEEKYLADLLSLADIRLSEEGHVVHSRRLPHPAKHEFGFMNFLAPSSRAPTVLSHAAAPVPVQETALGAARLAPRRLWPTDRLPSHDHHGASLSLVELSSPDKADALREAPCMVVAAARNERVLLPHFLTHYRRLGVAHFVIIDNLSTDGSREFLLEQPDVVLYSADSPYSLSRYGVTWQQTVLAAHATGRWALVADLDEFLVWPGYEDETLPALCERLSVDQVQAARVLLIDMYPEGALQDADFTTTPPFQAADCFDQRAAWRWQMGSGSYSNSPTWVSGLRHRLLPDSAPNHYTSQKVALLQHMPWVRCSEGLHYAAGLRVSPQLLGFAHFKFHRGFHDKVLEEVRRAQHYNAAEEYRQYQALLDKNSGSFFDPMHSRRYTDSQSFAELLS